MKIGKKIALITHMPFWLNGLGSHTVALNRYKLLVSMYETVNIIFMSGNSGIKMPYQGLVVSYDTLNESIISKIVTHVNSFGYDVFYCQYDFFTNIACQVKCKKVVEIHDVMHLRQASFKCFEQVAPFLTTEEAELNRLKQYDSVICLNQNESVYLLNQGILNIYTIAPNFEIRNDRNPKRDFLGLIGSSAKPNIDGILYYHNSLINIKGLVLAGSLSNTINRNIYTNDVNIMGLIPDTNSFYNLLYGSLVPVRFGAGVKIKTIESLVNLVPVFSTSHGVEGLPEGIAEVSCIFDKTSEWNLNNYNLLKNIKVPVIENYVNDNFSYAACAEKIKEAF